MAETEKYDIVIVGGGISGLYTAWRLASNTNYSIAVLEYSHRFGGRYCTCHMPGGFPAELGAMRYHPKEHPILQKLIDEFEIITEPYYDQKCPFKSMHFGKGRLCHSEKEKHKLYGIRKEDEMYMGCNVVTQVDLPKNGNFFKATLKGSTQLARNVSMTQLWAKTKNAGIKHLEGLFNDQSHTLTEICAYNIPFFKAMEVGKDFSQEMLAFSDGAETVIEKLIQRLNGLEITLLKKHIVTRVEELASGFKVKAMKEGSTPVWFSADRLILACNERGAELITWISEADRTTELHKLFLHINRIGGNKAVFTYKCPFWEKKGISSGTVQSDRLSSNFDLVGDRGKKGGYANVYIYNYDHTEILEGLNNPDEERYENKEGDVPSDLVPSRVAVEAIQSELRAIFSDIDVPDPVSTCMVDWSREPFGGCWRTPKLGTDHNTIYWKSLKPFGDDVEVYMIGDSFTAVVPGKSLPAWTEGVLLTAERVLHKYFHLTPYLDGLCLDNPWPEDS